MDITLSYHEAGHAVMAMAMGFAVHEISNIPSDSSLGHVKWEYPSCLTESSRTWVVLVLLSGIAAEHIYCKNNSLPEPKNWENYQTDLQQVALHLKELRNPNSINEYCNIAVRFLRQTSVWELVEILAALSMQASAINGQDFLQKLAKRVPRFSDVSWVASTNQN